MAARISAAMGGDRVVGAGVGQGAGGGVVAVVGGGGHRVGQRGDAGLALGAAQAARMRRSTMIGACWGRRRRPWGRRT
jgi:hypothetical protein